MNLYDALRQALPQYDIVPLTESNFDSFREIFDSNADFLAEGYGKLIDKKGIFGAISQLVDDFDPADKYLAAICQNGEAAAAIDLLANLPKQGRLYLSFLVVRGDLQGQGFGAVIAEGIIAAAALAGFSRIDLGSFDDAAEFWRKMGFAQSEGDADYLQLYRSVD